MKASFSKLQFKIKNKLKLTGFTNDNNTKDILDGIFAKAVILEEKKDKKVSK